MSPAAAEGNHTTGTRAIVPGQYILVAMVTVGSGCESAGPQLPSFFECLLRFYEAHQDDTIPRAWRTLVPFYRIGLVHRGCTEQGCAPFDPFEVEIHESVAKYMPYRRNNAEVEIIFPTEGQIVRNDISLELTTLLSHAVYWQKKCIGMAHLHIHAH